MKRIFGMSINKLLAVFFSGLAIVLLLTEMISSIVVYGAANTFTFSGIINYLLLFASYVVLLVMNIRNDDRAYLGITLIVFYIGFDGFYGIYDAFSSTIYYLTNKQVGLGCMSLFSILFWMGQLAMGIMTYLLIFRYRIGRTNNFNLLFLFACLFLISIVLTTASTIAIALMANPNLPASTIAVYLLDYGSQIAASISILFTLKRLRRF